MIIDEEDYIMHYGTPRHSGRYPWGSGKDPYQDNVGFLGYVEQLRKDGLSEVEIASGIGMTTTQLRAAKTIAKNQKKAADIAQAQRLRDNGWSNAAIGRKMNINESSVRALLAPGAADKNKILMSTSDMLKEQVAQKPYLDIGTGAETQLAISATKLNAAVAVLKEQGYEVHRVKLPQVGTGEMTEFKVLTPPGTTQKDVWMNRDKIQQIQNFSDDGGRTFLGIHPPLSIDSSRVGIKYGPDGGAEADGVIYVRPGVKDVSLGGGQYAQVRIMVDGTHYLKGMAVYKADLPKGVDLQFNTNKNDTGNKLDAMKPLKGDADNPFGASIRRQIVEVGSDGKTKVTSAMNILNEEGNWETHSKTLATQLLSKQSPTLAKNQLNLTYQDRRAQLDEILSLTNPAVKKKLLTTFADEADSSAVNLEAARLPRTSWHVILPVKTMKDNEVYAPAFRDGERVALVRYPHGGTFEIPELTVNNKHPDAAKLLGKTAKDAIAINSKVAARLSGADFDGDTVLVIPNNSRKIKSTPALEKLKGFDPQAAYPKYEGMPKMSDKQKQKQMGSVSNLITDMTIHGAPPSELARAVRHSMVVIDAQKHELNYKQSAIDNGIKQLQEKYQIPYSKTGKPGAATLISRATSETQVPERTLRRASMGGPIDPKTGEKVYEYSGATKTVTTVSKRTGLVTTKEVPKTIKSTKLAETGNAHTLSSGTTIETVYAEHSNRLKALANEARKASLSVKPTPYSPSAKKTYASEVARLNAKLDLVIRNRPLERQAQVLANNTVRVKLKSNPPLDKEGVKKLKSQALAEARRRTGAKRQEIEITPQEWQAIQAGAISTHKLSQILDKANIDQVKKLATPKAALAITPTKKARAQAMLSSGYTQAEVADALGVSVSTLSKSLKGE